MLRIFKRLRQKPIKITPREQELLARENEESQRQAMPDPAYGTFSSRAVSAHNFVATANDNIGGSADSAAKERIDTPTPPGPRK